MNTGFVKATKKKAKLRLALQGTAGSGKTYSALVLAQSLGKKIALIDTEKGSASLYSDTFSFDTMTLDYPFLPEKYVEGIANAEAGGYEVLVIDSISHEWQACLEIANQMTGNSFTNWGKITPRHDSFINAVLGADMHVIATMRAKSDYVLQEKNGKMVPQKVGLAAVQRDNVDYEFTMLFELNQNHIATCTKDRSSLFIGKDFLITQDTGQEILSWLDSGVDVVTGMRDELRSLMGIKDFDMDKFITKYGNSVDAMTPSQLSESLKILRGKIDKPTPITNLSQEVPAPMTGTEVQS